MTLILSIAFILLAGLVTLPLAKGAGPGRVGAFAALSILGVVAALGLVSADVVPTLGGSDSDAEVSEAEEKTLAEMEDALESEIQLSLVNSPSVESLRSDHPTLWQFEQDFVLLCAARDFPDSKVLDCWMPDGAIGAAPTPLEGGDEVE